MSNRLQTAVARALTVAFALSIIPFSGAQLVTNWVAYNDHRPGPLVPPHVPNPNSWGSATNVSGLDMGAPADSTGTLIDFLTGNPLAVSVTFTRTGSPNDFGAITKPLPTNTPAAEIFLGKCDLSNDGIVGLDTTDTATNFVTITFNNLNPDKRYLFRGTAARNGGYAPRWTVATIRSDGWIDAHINGAGGPGVITSNDFPANLGPGQAAWNSGHNGQGAVIGWDFITPFSDGSFSITCEQYVGPTPNGGTALLANYGYSFGAMLLAEVETAPPVIVTNPPALTTVEQNRPFSLSVDATGSPLLYQWYKEGVGAIPGATFHTFSVAQAALGDSGNYYVVVYNPLANATSTVAQVTVLADTNAPAVASIYSYPTVDPTGQNATLDQIVIEFDEPVDAASVLSPSSYVVPGGGNPVSVTITNNRAVVLNLATPLAEDTDYSVTVSGATDVVGNVAGSSSAQFHSWAAGPGNGLLYEAFRAGTGVDVTTLTSSPNYPDNPYLRTNLWIFDSRAVYPDNEEGEYGSRIRGVFIPPVSGNWVFFFRVYDRGVVYFNPNGLDPAGAQEILRESTGNEPRNWDKFTSSAFALQGGQGYYIESLQKADAGTGADVIKVAARLVGTGFPVPVDEPNTNIDASALSGGAIAFPLAPRDLGGALTIAQDLANATIEENNEVTLSVQLNNPSGLPLHYQWYRDGNAIEGANHATYVLNPTIAADDGATFSVRVAKVGSVVTSRTNTLTVVPDTTSPRVVSASTDGTNVMSVLVRFNEAMEPSLAADTINYTLGEGLFIASAAVEPDGKTVTLLLGEPLTLDQAYDLIISDLTDLSNNTLAPNPTTVTFIAGTNSAALSPRMTISRSANEVVISWPAVSGFILESSPVLPGTTWTEVGPIVPVGGQNTVTVPIQSGNLYFRLRR